MKYRAVARGAVIGVLSTLGLACGSDADDPNHQVSSFKPGQTESELRDRLGSPAAERRLGVSDGLGNCAEPAERVLEYPVPSRGTGKWLREKLGLPPAHTFEVCVDRDGRITSIWTSTVD